MAGGVAGSPQKDQALAGKGKPAPRWHALLESPWGSPHYLLVLRAFYEEQKLRALRSRPGQIDWEQMPGLLHGASLLFDYLGRRWAPSVLSPPARAWKQMELAREVTTFCLLDGGGAYSAAGIAWLDRLQTGLGQTGRDQALRPEWLAYYRLLLQILLLGCRREPVGTWREIEQIILGVLAGFGELHKIRADDNMEVDAQSICAATWMALAHRALPGQAVYDVWAAMHGLMGWPLLHKVSPPGLDPAKVQANVRWAEWLEAWATLEHEDWRWLLGGRSEYVRQLR